MLVLPASHNPLQGYFNDEAFWLHQKALDIVYIVSQKTSPFRAYDKSGCSLLQD